MFQKSSLQKQGEKQISMENVKILPGSKNSEVNHMKLDVIVASVSTTKFPLVKIVESAIDAVKNEDNEVSSWDKTKWGNVTGKMVHVVNKCR